MNTKIVLFILSFFLTSLSTVGIQAQGSSGGNMIVSENGALFIAGKHSFATGNGFITPGMISTSRIGGKGYVNFGKGSSWTGAAEGRFVNGYVRVTHEQPFVFPIGDENYSPVISSGAINTTAAYFSKSVTAAYVNRANNLSRVSDREYWDIGGDMPVKLSFVWGGDSDIEKLTSGQMEQLTLVGWRNNQWEIIPSMIPASDDLATQLTTEVANANFSKGVVSTSGVIIPNDYKYITLGTRQAISNPSDIISTYPNPVVENVHVNIEELEIMGTGEIKIYDMNGREMATRTIDRQSARIQSFDASNYVDGLYKVAIDVDDKQVTQKFIVGKTH